MKILVTNHPKLTGQVLQVANFQRDWVRTTCGKRLHLSQWKTIKQEVAK